MHAVHREIIVQLGNNSGHIANPFSPLFYPHRSDFPAPFHLMGQELIIKRFWIPCEWWFAVQESLQF